MNRRSFLVLGAMAGLAGLGRGPSFADSGLPAAAPAPAGQATGDALWLNWNENPLGLAPAARQAALEELARGNRYPDALRDRLAEALAARHGVAAESIVLGAGSTQVLQMIVLAAAAPGARLVLAEPTFEAVLGYQRPLGYEVVKVPLDGRFAHDLGRMREAVPAGRPALVYLCNPNNPTATLTPSAEIDAWITAASETVLFAVDEAYHEYVRAPGYRSAVKWVERPNVVVTRTFSKIYAMAGLRLGYAVAHPATARRLREFASSDNVNGPALAAALAALEDRDLVPRSRAANERARQITHACLDELELAYLPSHASFLMHRVTGDLATYRRRMEEHGIRVGRPFPPLVTHNRLSLGLPQEMERFTEVLRDFRRRGWV